MKWKLDAQLYSLLARYVCDLHALHDLWPRCDAKVRRQLARARACVFSVFIVYCVCQIAARASPRQEKKGISSVNRRQSLSQTHSAKLKQLKH